MKREISIYTIFVFLAFLFWGALSLSEEYTITIEVPINIVLPNENFAIEGYLPEKLEMKIRASGWSLLKIKYFEESNFNLQIKEAEDSFIFRTSNITNDILGFPSDVKILNIQPDIIKLSFNSAIEKKVKIYPRIVFSLKEGYELTTPIYVEPETILIKGSRKLLSRIDSLPTETIKLDQVSEFVSIETKVIDTLTNLITYEKIPVRISFDVQQVADKEFEKVPIELINVPKNKEVILLPSFVDVKLRGGINVLGNLSYDSIKVIVNYKNYSEKEGEEIKPEFNLPYGVKVLDYFPKQFKLIIRK
jgi:hypothetical protein